MKRIGWVIGIMAALVPFSAVFAIAQPDVITVNSVDCYEGVVQPADELCVALYTVTYTTPPTETATQAFIGRFLRNGIETNSVALYTYAGSLATTTPPYKGYGIGVFSFYWTAAEAASGFTPSCSGVVCQVVLQGNPTVFTGTIPTAKFSSIVWHDSKAGLNINVALMAAELQTNWSRNDIELLTVQSNQSVLTQAGQDYFTNAIPGLSQMIPSLFSDQLSSVALTEISLTPTVANTYENLYVGTALESGWNSLGSLFGVNSLTARVMLALVLMMAGMVGMTILTKRADFGVFIGFGVLPVLLTIIGLLPMAAAAVIILVSVIGIVFVKLYGR